MSNRLHYLLLGAAAGALLATPAFAQSAPAETTVESLIVTANKREQSLLTVPGSIAALGEDAMDDLLVNDVQDYADLIPGLDITAPVPGITKVTIRGLSSESVTSSVGVYINETPVTQNELDPDLKLYDVTRIEVLRGPQGTLYGEGSLGGTVKIVTNAPDMSGAYGGFESSASQYENGDGLNYAAAGFFNAPLGENAALRGVLSYRNNASWITNLGPGDAENDEQTLTGRLALKLRLSDTADLTLTYIGQSIELGGPRNVVDPALGDLTRSTRVDESVSDDLSILSATLAWDLGFADLTSDTSYYTRTQNTVGNNNQTGGTRFFYNEISGAAAGFGPFAQFGNPPGFPFVTTPESLVDFTGEAEQLTQEIRLVSKPGERFDWIVGAFYKDRHDTKDTYFEGVITNSPVVNFAALDIRRSRTLLTFDWKQIAVFGEVTIHLSPSVDFTAGLRYASEEVGNRENLDGLFQYNFGSFPATTTPVQFGPVSDTFESTTPRFVLSYKMNEDWMAYATASKGFRSGGFTGVTPFKPDSVWNYEIGLKGHTADNRFSLAAALYKIEWTDVQVFDDIATPPFFAVRNIGEAEVTGFELEVTARPTDRLELAAGLNMIDTEITAIDPSASDPDIIAAKGNELQKVPNLSYSASGTYTWPVADGWEGRATLSLAYQGESFSDFRNLAAEELDAYTTVATRIGVESDRYSVFLFGRNLTDERIQLDVSGAGSAVVGTTVGRPRMIGVEFKAKFN